MKFLDEDRSPTEEIRELQRWYREAVRESARKLNAEYAARWEALKAKHKEYLETHYGEM